MCSPVPATRIRGMRMVKGLILLLIGAGWGYPGVLLLWMKLRSLQSNAAIPVDEVNIFGQPFSFRVACAIILLPAVALIGSGIYMLRTLPRDEF